MADQQDRAPGDRAVLGKYVPNSSIRGRCRSSGNRVTPPAGQGSRAGWFAIAIRVSSTDPHSRDVFCRVDQSRQRNTGTVRERCGQPFPGLFRSGFQWRHGRSALLDRNGFEVDHGTYANKPGTGERRPSGQSFRRRRRWVLCRAEESVRLNFASQMYI